MDMADERQSEEVEEREEEESDESEESGEEESKKVLRAMKYPPVSEKEDLSVLAHKYRKDEVIPEKIKVLGERYGEIRRTRPDGNSFFRSFLFCCMEHFCQTQDDYWHSVAKRIVEKFKGMSYMEDLKDFVNLLSDVMLQEGSAPSLLQLCKEETTSNKVATALRAIISTELRAQEELFEPLVSENYFDTYDEFLEDFETRGVVNDVHLTVLSDALGIPIRLVYLGGSRASSSCHINWVNRDFVPVPLVDTDTSGLFVTLLQLYGHYDILYLKL